ncbi:uncharacterized protein N0V89_012553 [Didymosphaeria variabile]|uniref:Uncharacterized protein n=1 Tax=Didymosphaeria variabile TaxID=1932322 RepID=A0A9W8X9D3_9PLEO|nr:uncharacterized protein N0V89_012553 [Didymosphaeria variabile]KAJ4344809.1 hypothetical protein N0V89_012553 [Didymosphaeria variabile]
MVQPHQSTSSSGCAVGSSPESLPAGTTLFITDRPIAVRPLAIRARAPHLHPHPEASPHSTSAAIPIKSLPAPPALPRRLAPFRPLLSAALPTTLEGYTADGGAGGNSGPRQVKVPTLGKGTAPRAGCPHRNARQVHPGPLAAPPLIPPRFAPIQDSPPDPEAHKTVIQRGFNSPGNREVKKEPVLVVEDDPVKKWQEYRAVLAELREKYERMKVEKADWKGDWVVGV